MYDQIDPKKQRVCVRCRQAFPWKECLVHKVPVTWTDEEWAALGAAQEKLIKTLCQGDKGDKTVPKYAYSCKKCTVEVEGVSEK
eukprot:10248465-Alexandrium_andersonii.AAC.1